MFTIKLENGKILKGLIETLASIIDETELVVTPKEFIITAMDPSRICLLKLSIKKKDFDEYKCEKETKIGLNLDDFDKILKRCGPKDSIQITFKDEEQKIKVVMIREGNARKRTFSLALIDLEIEDIPMDNLLGIEYPSSWLIDTNFIIESVKDAEIYSEILQMKAIEKKGLIFASYGQIGEMEYELGSEELAEFKSIGSNTGSYSITFLKNVLKLANITEKLEISLKTDHPLKMHFDLLEGGKLDYFLAPRVEEPDFDEEDEF